VILAHNHPSGDATPSPEDQDLTSRLKQTGEILGIAVLDHLVFGDPVVHSLLHGPVGRDHAR
jgi:DNA repair protein RadC